MKRVFTAAVVVLSLALCSVAVAAVSLNGTWKEKVHSSALGGVINGTWTIKAKSGHYTVSFKGLVVDRGKYSVKGSKVSFKDTGGRDKCPGTGVYSYKLTAKALKFKAVKDSAACAGRRAVLTAGTFKRA
jgi:hypothetical protein